MRLAADSSASEFTSSLGRLILSCAACILLFSGLTPIPAQDPDADQGTMLFRKYVPADDDPNRADENRYFQAAAADLGVANTELIQFEFDPLQLGSGRDVNLNIRSFFDENAKAPGKMAGIIEEDPLHADELVWTATGDADDEDADAGIMVVHGENVSGLVRQDGRLHQIIPVGDGVHALTEIDPAKFPSEHGDEDEDDHIADNSDELLRQIEAQDQLADNNADGGPTVIDVLVAWTPAVQASVLDPRGLADLALRAANDSYVRSGVNVKLRLVAAYETKYRESSTHEQDLRRFRATNDNNMDEVHKKRKETGADVCILFVNSRQNACGLASVIGAADAKDAFALVQYSCAVGNLSFAHEIGHLQGARHDVDRTPGFNHGFVSRANGVRTVMAYQRNCPGCERVRRWSGPNVTYEGTTMGNSNRADNARMLNETAAHIAGLAGGDPPPVVVQPEEPVNPPAPATGRKEGYAWAYEPETDRYTVTGNYHYSSSGQDIIVERCSEGRYLVIFKGLGGGQRGRGNVQVTGFSRSSFTHAQLRGWKSTGNDFTAHVDCYNSQGQRADGEFTVHVFWTE